MSVLDGLIDGMESTLLAHIGDSITYHPNGGAGVPLNAWVDYGEDIVTGAISAASITRITVEVSKIDVPVPTKNDRVVLPRIPGRHFAPSDWRHSGRGNTWLIETKRVA